MVIYFIRRRQDTLSLGFFTGQWPEHASRREEKIPNGPLHILPYRVSLHQTLVFYLHTSGFETGIVLPEGINLIGQTKFFSSDELIELFKNSQVCRYLE